MTRFEVSVDINKPLTVVYLAYINPDNMLYWQSDLVCFEIESGEFGEPGALVCLHYNQNGKQYVLEDRLELLVSEKQIVSRVSGSGLSARVETRFDSTDDSTKLSLIWDGTGKNFLVSLMIALLRNKIKKRALSELTLFKELVEKFGERFEQ